MMRQAAAVSAGLLCTLYGFRAAAQLRQQAADIRRWADILSHMALLISEASLPIPQVMRLAASASTGPDRLLQAMAQTMEADPLVTPAEAFAHHARQDPWHEPLQRMFSGIGHGDAAGRALAAEQAARELSCLAEQAEKRAANDVGLYRTLGWTGGACLTLLLL